MTRNAPQAPPSPFPPSPFPFRDHFRSFDLISSFFSDMLFVLVTVRATPAKDSASSLSGVFLFFYFPSYYRLQCVSRSPLDATCYILHVTFSISLESPNHLCPRPPLHSPTPLHFTQQLTMPRLKTEKLLSTTPAPEQWTGTAHLDINITSTSSSTRSAHCLKDSLSRTIQLATQATVCETIQFSH
jgi:hypothetical protein